MLGRSDLYHFLLLLSGRHNGERDQRNQQHRTLNDGLYIDRDIHYSQAAVQRSDNQRTLVNRPRKINAASAQTIPVTVKIII